MRRYSPFDKRTIAIFAAFLGIGSINCASAAEKTPANPSGSGVSYSRDVAPSLGIYCGACHSPGVSELKEYGKTEASGNLDISSHEQLLKGGRSGPVIVPGDVARSALSRLIHGGHPPSARRQFQPKMPASKAAVIDRWIEEGANSDVNNPVANSVIFRRVKVDRDGMDVLLRLTSEAYATMTVRRPDGNVLMQGVGAAAWDMGGRDTAPGGFQIWRLSRAPQWPGEVDVRVDIWFGTQSALAGSMIAIARGSGNFQAPDYLNFFGFHPNPIPSRGRFSAVASYWVADAGTVSLEILHSRQPNGQPLFKFKSKADTLGILRHPFDLDLAAKLAGQHVFAKYKLTSARGNSTEVAILLGVSERESAVGK